MQAIKLGFRKDIDTLARRLLLVNGFKNGDYNPHNVGVYAISHEFGVFALAIGSHEQEALDNAVDDECMDCMIMDQEDFQEYEDNGWHDSFILAGNASEPFWSEYLGISRLI